MIERYLYTIGKQLPPKNRDDILKEIESNLYDQLEEQHGLKAYTDAEKESVIRTLGHPKAVAKAYSQNARCLIGPALIDTYFLIIKLALAGMAIGIGVSLLVEPDRSTLDIFIHLLSNLWNGTLSVIGMVTLIFGLIHYFNPDEIESLEENWSLDQLVTPPAAHAQVSRPGLIVGSFFILFFLYWLNNGIPIMINPSTIHVIAPNINTENFEPLLPFINISLLFGLLINIVLLVRGAWEKSTRLLSILMNLLIIAFVWILFFSPDLVQWSNISSVDIEAIKPAIQIGLNVGAGVITVINLIEIGSHIRHLWHK